MGHLIEVLKETGNYDNSVIIYMSDHGPAFAGAKTTVYEPGLRTPLIVKMPGQTESRVTEAMVHWPDITPTLLEIAGVDEPVYYQHIGAPSIREQFDFPSSHGLHGKIFSLCAKWSRVNQVLKPYMHHTLFMKSKCITL